jgi:hypothetical protein
MSALGHKRKWCHARVMSVLPLKADIRQREWHVRYVPISEVLDVTRDYHPQARSKSTCFSMLLAIDRDRRTHIGEPFGRDPRLDAMYDKLCLSSLDKSYPGQLLRTIGASAAENAPSGRRSTSCCPLKP